MTNNTTAPALTDEQIDAIYDAVPWQDLNVNSLDHAKILRRRFARALLTSPRAAVPATDPWLISGRCCTASLMNGGRQIATRSA
ncbi:hypothetical protein [Burkholderia glumae]|uniref:hypothetical protein n=1 Tax=Burkholderia glumae TaxID=337 RepID=UPI00131F5C8D|nr:hypothetical protein [Burkholderia glumae]QHE11888.1 hypothetical protein GQR88_16815 [Burkholderia glumae AU6208]